MNEQSIEGNEDQDFENNEHPLDSTEEPKLIRKKGKDLVIDLMDPRSFELLGEEEWSRKFDIAFRYHYGDDTTVEEWQEKYGQFDDFQDYYHRVVVPRQKLNEQHRSSELAQRIDTDNQIERKIESGRRLAERTKRANRENSSKKQPVLDDEGYYITQQERKRRQAGQVNPSNKMNELKEAYSQKLAQNIISKTLESIRRMVGNTQGENITIEEGLELIDCVFIANEDIHLGSVFTSKSNKDQLISLSEIVSAYKLEIVELQDSLVFNLRRFEIKIDEFGIVNLQSIIAQVVGYNNEILKLDSIFNEELRFKIIVSYMEQILDAELGSLIYRITDSKLVNDLNKFLEENPTRYHTRMRIMKENAPQLFEYIYNNFINSNPTN